MIDLRFRPLKEWPSDEPKLRRRGDAFKTAWPKTLDKMEYELHHLRAKDIVIEAGFTLADLRNDGWPSAGRNPLHPGVILYFKGADGALRFPCGTYSRWQANVHAIALTLENLRAIDRYGVTLGHQQYLGFASLPAAPQTMSIDSAAIFIASVAVIPKDYILDNRESYLMAYRRAVAKLHPDVAGNNDGFYQLSQAKELLDRHHGLQVKTA